MSADDELARLKGEILTSMAQVEDAHHRVVLSLLIRTMNTQEHFANGIFEKLEMIIKDEERIKEIVLNGHVHEHKRHHDWVEERMLYVEREKTDEVLRWAHHKMESENLLGEEKRHTFRSVLEKLLYAGIVLLLGLVVSDLWYHMQLVRIK
jgi:hypothetical protein